MEPLFTDAQQKAKIFVPATPGNDLRPNFFVSVPITEPTLVNTVLPHVGEHPATAVP